ncbi:MAG: hypothetical protein KDC71_23130, partial [Acidobacteria bacterium]|nr:hypothetical protein [Acidobacteriota bacterium]
MSLQLFLMVVFGFVGGPEPMVNLVSSVPAQEEDYFYWDVFCDFNQNVFPAYHLATATIKPPAYDEWGENLAILGDPNGRFGVFVHGAPGSYVRMALRKNAIMEESLFSGYIPENAMDAFILPKVLFDYDALRKIKQPMPLNLVVTIQFDDEPSEQKAVTVALRSINDCLFGRL